MKENEDDSLEFDYEAFDFQMTDKDYMEDSFWRKLTNVAFYQQLKIHEREKSSRKPFELSDTIICSNL